mgnify:FL=1
MCTDTEAANQIASRLNADSVFSDLNGKTINLHTNLKGSVKRRNIGGQTIEVFEESEKDNGEFIFAFDIDPTAQVNYINYKLTEVGGNWAMLNPAGTSGQGMTIGNDGHTLSDSFNLGFAFTGVPNGAAVGTGDVLAGAYNFRLISMVGVNEVASFDGQLVLV